MKRAYPYIRWSSKKQEEGDSERRQRELIEQSKEWLKGLGYQLDESMNLIDKGESAFTGTPPALGRFLKAVATGEVKKGSMLIAESFDRLNRNNPEDAMRQFLDLKRDGILIGILNNWKVYQPGQDWTELILPLVESGRSHEESKRKQGFTKTFWVGLRSKAANGERSRHKHPYWLRWDEKTKQYVPVDDAVKAVRHVYKLKLQGDGAITISKKMNQLRIWMPQKSKGNKTGMWTSVLVNRYLQSKTVIGTYEPHFRRREKRPDGSLKQIAEPAGDPIPNYYPPIFDKDEEHIFYEVQRIMDRAGKLPGRGGGNGTGKTLNVFSGVLRCGLCKGSLNYLSKAYLQCRKAREKHECTAKSVSYHEFEKLFFENVEQLTVEDILPTPQEQENHVEQLRRELKENQKYLLTLDTKAESFLKVIEISKDNRNRAIYDKRLTDANNEIERVSKAVKQIQEELQSAEGEAKKLQVLLSTSNDLYQKLRDMPEGPEKVALRKRILNEIRELVDSIEIYPLQVPYKPIQEIDFEDDRGRGKEYESPGSGIVRIMESKAIDHFRIKFRAGHGKTLSTTVFLNRAGDSRGD